ncbi:TRAP transporter substrate-binding protein [Paracoccus sp. (in: a-proteobacteria)]|uniref:TRAP transporter substrate-binding protein n=1 Tax=Paracoccus sp. TaxID=267 RepID=UPI003A87D4EC
MMKLNRRQFTALAGAAMLATPAIRANAAGMTLKLGHLGNEETSWHKAGLKFGEEVARLTEGRVEVQVFPNESLGKDMDLINGLQLGTVDFSLTGENLQNWAPSAALLAVPYAYNSLEMMDEVASGEIGKNIEAEILARVQIRPLTYFARGPRNLTSNREIVTPDDLQSLRLRVPNVPLFLKTWEALGAAPSPMAFSEVFTALQNGTIDAQENPLSLINSASFFEVQKFVNKTEHVRSWIYLSVSEITWGRLSEADRQAVLEAAATAQGFERELFLADEQGLTSTLQDKGMTFVESDTAAFAAKAKDAVLANVGADIRPVAEQLFARQG